MTRSLLLAVPAVAVLLGVSACTPTGAPPAAVAVAVPPPVNQRVVVAIRPVPTPDGNTGSILGAVGSSAAAAETVAAFEFILRDDDGQTLSVVQTNEAGLHPGEHVVLSSGPWTRVSRAAD